MKNTLDSDDMMARFQEINGFIKTALSARFGTEESEK
jgi:hypothetical protein